MHIYIASIYSSIKMLDFCTTFYKGNVDTDVFIVDCAPLQQGGALGIPETRHMQNVSVM